MAALVRAGFSNLLNAVKLTSVRSVSTTTPLNIKRIKEHREGESLVVEALTVPSPRTKYLVKPENIPALVEANKSLLESIGRKRKKTCYMCSLGLDLKHTDVLILSQFVRSDGCMLPRRITGLCKRQQIKIGKMVSMAQKAGLMMNLTPANSSKNPKKRRDWKQFNTYFDEKTIFMKKIPKQEDKFER